MNNTREMTRTQLETLYRVMMKRISKGLSAEKLSFLIGRDADYISNIEMLHTRPYSIPDLKCIASALEEKNFRTFFPDLDDSIAINVMMESEINGQKLVHICSIISGEHKKISIFQLQEDASAGTAYAANHDHDIKQDDLKIANDAVKLLVNADYFFAPRLPVNIYQSINQFLKITLNPAHLEKALNSFCRNSGNTILKREEKGKHGFYYVMA